eukprot:CAMPEP_0114689834 /NCGR_PEP_ID=MMETSP0191-20121206/65001_1 /TAXON_ID=126664 /ORGANISM="Sorites sp." /LENGTH=44 /DNA_ID= /DNA_START= /DNA_END= /DNA_ORIENTATION=
MESDPDLAPPSNKLNTNTIKLVDNDEAKNTENDDDSSDMKLLTK